MKRQLISLVGLLALSFNSVGEEDFSVNITVSGASPNQGSAILSLFESSSGHLRKPLMSLRQEVDENGKVQFQLSGMENHFYSVSVFYDKDGNGQLSTGFAGVPIEPIGFSNNAKGQSGPPSFNQAKFNPVLSRDLEIKLSSVLSET